MQATTSPPDVLSTMVPSSAAPDLRRIRRTAGAVALVLGPLAVGLVRATIPLEKPGSSTSGSDAIGAIARDAGAQRLTILFGVVAVVVLPFAMITLVRLVSRRAPVLGAIGGALAIVGWSMVPVLVTLDALGYELSRLGATATTTQVWERVQGSASIGILTAIFVVGHVLGTLLLAVGLHRGRWVPAWAMVAVVVGDLIHPLAAFSASRTVEVAAFALVLIGLVPAAAALLRLDDGEWDLASR